MALGDEFALVEIGPLIEKTTETVGRLILENPSFDGFLKVLPLPEALRQLCKKQEDTSTQVREDKRKVITVYKACQIIDQEWTKLAEAGDLASLFQPYKSGTTTGGILSPIDRCKKRIREACLSQASGKFWGEYKYAKRIN